MSYSTESLDYSVEGKNYQPWGEAEIAEWLDIYRLLPFSSAGTFKVSSPFAARVPLTQRPGGGSRNRLAQLLELHGLRLAHGSERRIDEDLDDLREVQRQRGVGEAGGKSREQIPS